MTTPRSSATDPGTRLVAALVDRDFRQLARVLTADARMRALIPLGLVEVSGAEAVAAQFSSWFGDAEELKLVRSGSDTIADRLHVFYRLRVKKPGGLRRTVEQHLLCTFDNERLTALDLVCTGFRPDEGGHMHARNRIKLGLSVGLVGLALAVPLAHGGTRPNDRPGMLGVGPQQVADTSDVVSRYLARHPAAPRPDDRAGIRGPQQAADTSDVVSRYLARHPAAPRPDDRAGIRAPSVVDEAAIAESAPSPSKTSWRAGELAGTGAFVGAILLAVVAFAFRRRRRSAAALPS